MRLDPRMKKIEEKINTTKYEPSGDFRPMRNFYPNTEAMSSLPFDTDEILLSISDEPFDDGEVALVFPPVPFHEIRGNSVLYQHTAERKKTSRRKPRPAPSTPELPATQVYVIRSFLDGNFVAARKPLYLGISAIPETVIEDEKPPTANDGGSGDAIDRADALAALDAFLRDYVRVQRRARLTSRQIWAMWAKYHQADSASEVIRGIRLRDISRRFRAVFGVIMVENSTRIDGIHQRYWDGYIITSPSP